MQRAGKFPLCSCRLMMTQLQPPQLGGQSKNLQSLWKGSDFVNKWTSIVNAHQSYAQSNHQNHTFLWRHQNLKKMQVYTLFRTSTIRNMCLNIKVDGFSCSRCSLLWTLSTKWRRSGAAVWVTVPDCWVFYQDAHVLPIEKASIVCFRSVGPTRRAQLETKLSTCGK